MGHTKRRNQKPAPVRSRTTRSKGKALGDPTENTELLTRQLRSLGLYAAHTLGDGNCLFRALSDQLYGTESYHQSLRQDICNWIESHKERYEPFVEDERGFDVHLQCMRQQATYGGHMELSAFAHMMRRNVKVIQPGLVYVIEWNAGNDPVAEEDFTSASQSGGVAVEDGVLSNREKRRKRSAKEAPTRPPLPDTTDESVLPPTVYVAYHDWEHFSSIRNLRGPHSGLPNIKETPAPDDDCAPPSPELKKPASKGKSKEYKPASKRALRNARTGMAVEENLAPLPSTPSQVPLPSSRSPSPTPSIQSPMPFPLPAELSGHGYRSPKRTFDESSASSEGSQSAAKRAKGPSRPPFADTLPTLSGTQTPAGDDEDREKTPSLSVSGPESPASSSSLSSVPSPEPTPPPEERPPPVMTQRQRKRLGVPRPAQAARTRASAGKIVIPGGRFKGARSTGNAQKKLTKEDSEEWQKNGTGRLDVRGFRELKI